MKPLTLTPALSALSALAMLGWVACGDPAPPTTLPATPDLGAGDMADLGPTTDQGPGADMGIDQGDQTPALLRGVLGVTPGSVPQDRPTRITLALHLEGYVPARDALRLEGAAIEAAALTQDATSAQRCADLARDAQGSAQVAAQDIVCLQATISPTQRGRLPLSVSLGRQRAPLELAVHQDAAALSVARQEPYRLKDVDHPALSWVLDADGDGRDDLLVLDQGPKAGLPTQLTSSEATFKLLRQDERGDLTLASSVKASWPSQRGFEYYDTTVKTILSSQRTAPLQLTYFEPDLAGPEGAGRVMALRADGLVLAQPQVIMTLDGTRQLVGLASAQRPSDRTASAKIFLFAKDGRLLPARQYHVAWADPLTGAMAQRSFELRPPELDAIEAAGSHVAALASQRSAQDGSPEGAWRAQLLALAQPRQGQPQGPATPVGLMLRTIDSTAPSQTQPLRPTKAPSLSPQQRLEAQLIDLDQDGHLDLVYSALGEDDLRFIDYALWRPSREGVAGQLDSPQRLLDGVCLSCKTSLERGPEGALTLTIVEPGPSPAQDPEALMASLGVRDMQLGPDPSWALVELASSPLLQTRGLVQPPSDGQAQPAALQPRPFNALLLLKFGPESSASALIPSRGHRYTILHSDAQTLSLSGVGVNARGQHEHQRLQVQADASGALTVKPVGEPLSLGESSPGERVSVSCVGICKDNDQDDLIFTRVNNSPSASDQTASVHWRTARSDWKVVAVGLGNDLRVTRTTTLSGMTRGQDGALEPVTVMLVHASHASRLWPEGHLVFFLGGEDGLLRVTPSPKTPQGQQVLPLGAVALDGELTLVGLVHEADGTIVDVASGKVKREQGAFIWTIGGGGSSADRQSGAGIVLDRALGLHIQDVDLRMIRFGDLNGDGEDDMMMAMGRSNVSVSRNRRLGTRWAPEPHEALLFAGDGRGGFWPAASLDARFIVGAQPASATCQSAKALSFTDEVKASWTCQDECLTQVSPSLWCGKTDHL